jgi:hypothetical protein
VVRHQHDVGGQIAGIALPAVPPRRAPRCRRSATPASAGLDPQHAGQMVGLGLLGIGLGGRMQHLEGDAIPDPALAGNAGLAQAGQRRADLVRPPAPPAPRPCRPNDRYRGASPSAGRRDRSRDGADRARPRAGRHPIRRCRAGRGHRSACDRGCARRWPGPARHRAHLSILPLRPAGRPARPAPAGSARPPASARANRAAAGRRPRRRRPRQPPTRAAPAPARPAR